MAVRAEHFGLSTREYKNMLQWGVPIAIFNICYWLCRNSDSWGVSDIDFIEWFAGVAMVHKAFKRRGFASLAYDINQFLGDSDIHDLCHVRGLLLACRWMSRQRWGAASHWATVCSTWVWLSRASTHRSEISPLGRGNVSRGVAQANEMVATMVALIRWSLARHGVFILEQPATSLMIHHPRLEALKLDLRRRQAWHETRMFMGAWGAPTVKPSVLYANVPLSILKKPLSAVDMLRIREESGEHKVTKRDAAGTVSGAEGLKATQEYSVEYGEAAATALTCAAVVEIEDADSEGEIDVAADNWADTGLPTLCEWIGLPYDRFVV